jgi:hypothetical protein
MRYAGLLLLCATCACSTPSLVTGDGTGGAAAGTGGVVGATGGAQSSGGAVATGGASTGGASSGGSGGGTGTGGTPATGGTTGGSGGSDFFGASRCAAGNFLLCDGFEADAIDTALWTVEKSGANVVEIAADQAARGTKSVHIHAENNYGYLKNTSIFPVANNDYFGRMFLRVARFSTVDWAHWTVGEAAGTGDGSLIRVGGQYKTDAAANRWGIGSDAGPTGDWTTHDTDPDGAPLEPATNAWVCLEWEHKGSTNETHFFVDGILHPSLSTTATTHGLGQGIEPPVDYILPNVTSFWFGWYQYQADPEAFDVWIDEVALDDQRIGCEL